MKTNMIHNRVHYCSMPCKIKDILYIRPNVPDIPRITWKEKQAYIEASKASLSMPNTTCGGK